MTDDERWARGAAEFTAVTGMPAPAQGDDYVADVVIDQVFAEIWTASRAHPQGAPVDLHHVRLDERGPVRHGDPHRSGAPFR